MIKLENTQRIQENKYNLPYHYLVTISENYFSQHKHIKWGYEYSSYVSFIVNYLKKINFKSLIDIGCGDGKFLNEVNKRIPGKDLTGIDYSERAVGLAKLMTPNVKFINKDITLEYTFGNEKYEVATLIETLEHIKPNKISIFVNAISDMLNNKAYLLVSVPSENEQVDKHHYQHFNIDKIKKYLSPYFQVMKPYYLNKSNKGVKRISKVLSNNLFILNNRKLLNWLYGFYNKNYLIADKNNARRIFVICQKR